MGVAEEVSDISLACRQVGPIHFKKKFSQGEDMFRQRRSLFFKKMQIVRGCDVKRNVLVYMVYSDKLIEGSPKNSTASVPVMPWGADGHVEKCADWIEHLFMCSTAWGPGEEKAPRLFTQSTPFVARSNASLFFLDESLARIVFEHPTCSPFGLRQTQPFPQTANLQEQIFVFTSTTKIRSTLS
jgi:hypothetical protein